MKGIGIKYKLTLCSIIPVLLVVVLFVTYYPDPLDTPANLIKHYQMIIATVFITLFGLFISLILHFFLRQDIYLPLARLQEEMRQIMHNPLDTEISQSNHPELGVIQQGCAYLQKEYRHQVEVASHDLQQNLLALEEKNIELSLEKKKIEEKSRQKTEFIANMSHEIRTPMSGVIGFINVLLESKLDPLQLDYVKTIQASAEDLLEIVNDILDYSKIEAGKLTLDCIPLNLRTCLDEVLTLTAAHAHKKGIELIASTDIAVPKTILGDAFRIKQILSNLVSNAIKFTDTGYVLIHTSIASETDKDYLVSISVTDTGIGISLENQTKLFTAFNQADTSITRRFGGSGLGLVICKKLAEAMKGQIFLESELHKGSVFTVTITVEKSTNYVPKLEVPLQTNTPFDTIDSLRKQTKTLYPNVLIAEDSPVNQMLFKSLFRDNAEVTIAKNGMEAVDIAENQAFDVMFFDLQMPKKNGLEAATVIREESLLNKHTPIILISANNNDVSREALEKVGIDLCLQKPILEAEFLTQLLRVVHKAIDWSVCVAKVSGNQSLAEEFFTSFVAELGINKTEFQKLLAEQDYQGLEDAAHKLNGACCFCGVPRLQQQVQYLEKIAAKPPQVEKLPAAVSALLQRMDEVVREYERL